LDYTVLDDNGLTKHGAKSSKTFKVKQRFSRNQKGDEEKRNERERNKVAKILKLIEKKRKRKGENFTKVWNEQVIHKIIFSKHIKLTCILSIVGKGWIDLNEMAINDLYSKLYTDEELVFDKGSRCQFHQRFTQHFLYESAFL